MAAHVPTPLTPHLRSERYQTVYEPSEDSFLLLDALEKDQQLLKDRNPLVCAEIGSGSGVVLTFLATLLGNSSYYLAADINFNCAHCTQQTFKSNGVQYSDCVNDNLLMSLRTRLAGAVDVLLFNPPYVQTPSDEVILACSNVVRLQVRQVGGTDLSASWAGGINGREVVDLILPHVNYLLSDSGCFYLVAIKENKPDEICQFLSLHGLSSERVLSRKAKNEHLTVLKFEKLK